MNESKPDYGAMNSQELRQHLEGYDFVTPTGEPLAPFLDSLMGENLDPKTLASIARTSRQNSLLIWGARFGTPARGLNCGGALVRREHANSAGTNATSTW